MTYMETLFVKQVKLSCIDESKLLKKRASLADSLELANRLAKEFESQFSNHKIVDGIGVVIILTSFVSDILRDTVGEVVSKENPLMRMGLSNIYDKIRDEKWKGNKYEKTIASIKSNVGYLEKLAKLDKTGMYKMVVVVHKNMAMNAVGLAGYMEGSKEAQMILINSIKSLKKNINALENEIQRIKYYLDTGEGENSSQKYTPASNTVGVGKLG